MSIKGRGDETSHGFARNSVTGAQLTYVRREGERDESFSVYRYRNDIEDFEVCVKGEQGMRQALALLPNPHHRGDLTVEGWRDLRKRRDVLADSLNISHVAVVEVRKKMPLALPLAKDLLHLAWTTNHGPREKSDTSNFTAGFLNVDPNARIEVTRPYLKIDQDGVFSINDKGNW